MKWQILCGDLLETRLWLCKELTVDQTTQKKT